MVELARRTSEPRKWLTGFGLDSGHHTLAILALQGSGVAGISEVGSICRSELNPNDICDTVVGEGNGQNGGVSMDGTPKRSDSLLDSVREASYVEGYFHLKR